MLEPVVHVRIHVGVEVFRQVLLTPLAVDHLEVRHTVRPYLLMEISHTLVIWHENLPFILACLSRPLAFDPSHSTH
jgi:hypothetical protein